MKARSSPMARPTRSAPTRMSPASCSAHRSWSRGRAVLLELNDINTFRGPAHVLRDVSIAVDNDEVVALIGRNGAGRTTIIESITGLLPMRSGRIQFRGEDITALPPHRRAQRGIGYSPENSGIFPELTVPDKLIISGWLAAKTERSAAAAANTEKLFSVFPEVHQLQGRQGL